MKKDDDHDFPPLSAADPVKDWKRWKRDLSANLMAQTDESGTNPMDHIMGRDMGGAAPGGLELSRAETTPPNKQARPLGHRAKAGVVSVDSC